jgi:hypothetical protein
MDDHGMESIHFGLASAALLIRLKKWDKISGSIVKFSIPEL